MADRISVPPSGTELTPTALEADSLYHCQGSPQSLIFKEQLVQLVNNIIPILTCQLIERWERCGGNLCGPSIYAMLWYKQTDIHKTG